MWCWSCGVLEGFFAAFLVYWFKITVCHMSFFPNYILFCSCRAGWLARINFSVTESTYRSCVCLCSVDEDEDDDEGDEDEEVESLGGAEKHALTVCFC